ncbi:hypothetical protein FOMPIDRAFT_1054790 [Fomitopsis schrenkii]|uniref:Uncharacterized protein n=1 Tax=Fomitopsis schrenkii TaxID=2126942 RepID=S8DU92_FOMSC|nr:hypothetical protein FOMPIDRAFT_1054790 [Fomitopsis schrenkii]
MDPAIVQQFKQSAVDYGPDTVVPSFVEPIGKARGREPPPSMEPVSGGAALPALDTYRPEPQQPQTFSPPPQAAQKRRASAGISAQPAKKQKANNAAAGAAMQKEKGKQKAKPASAKYTAAAAAAAAASDEDTANSDDEDSSVDEAAPPPRKPGTPVLRSRSMTVVTASGPSDRDISLEDFALRAHAANAHLMFLASDLAIKHALAESHIRLEATAAAANICRAWKDYYAAANVASKQGHTLPPPKLPQPPFAEIALAVPDVLNISAMVDSLVPFKSRFIEPAASVSTPGPSTPDLPRTGYLEPGSVSQPSESPE